MRTIIRYSITCAALYLGINWIADNPAKFNAFRKEVNSAVSTGIETGSEVIKEVTE